MSAERKKRIANRYRFRKLQVPPIFLPQQINVEPPNIEVEAVIANDNAEQDQENVGEDAQMNIAEHEPPNGDGDNDVFGRAIETDHRDRGNGDLINHEQCNNGDMSAHNGESVERGIDNEVVNFFILMSA